ncbi:hypothetical protein B0H16DRAFT_234414 [Mycena metata]|uniref:Uncharacterized protein n=1 Tax=Mycena metata TaxID=1033252 RepID=A0AAD7NPP2_9AGAR|nr:hypothetical protein B0H16DRAFT_234414 [Mycena metata]
MLRRSSVRAGTVAVLPPCHFCDQTICVSAGLEVKVARYREDGGDSRGADCGQERKEEPDLKLSEFPIHQMGPLNVDANTPTLLPLHPAPRTFLAQVPHVLPHESSSALTTISNIFFDYLGTRQPYRTSNNNQRHCPFAPNTPYPCDFLPFKLE